MQRKKNKNTLGPCKKLFEDRMNSIYKEEHERFVSGYEGTSVLEITVVSFLAPVCVLLRNTLLNWIAGSQGTTLIWLTFGVDFVTLIVSMLCAFTVLSSHLEAYYTGIVVVIGSLLLLTDKINSKVNPQIKSNFTMVNLMEKIVIGKKPFITNWRANVNVATAICILAVDFVIFPRTYCKAETYGTGLMDVGVGAFVLSNAVVSPEARGKDVRASFESIKKSVKSTLPLWVLGCVRLVSVKSIDYQEHVSEYGVHWNFFFTLAVVRVLATMVYCVILPNLSWLLGIAVTCGYQYALTGPLKLDEFIVNGPDGTGSREGLISANREGLFSCLGYLAIYFIGVQLGKYLFKPRHFFKEWLKVLLTLVILEVLSWLLLCCLDDSLEPVSRRLANLPYVVWVMQFNLLMLIGFLLVDILDMTFKQVGILIPEKTVTDAGDSRIHFNLLEAINRNGLLYFLLANLLTGLVNMSVKTIHMSPFVGFAIVYMYLLVLSCIMCVLHLKNISLKFW